MQKARQAAKVVSDMLAASLCSNSPKPNSWSHYVHQPYSGFQQAATLTLTALGIGEHRCPLFRHQIMQASQQVTTVVQILDTIKDVHK